MLVEPDGKIIAAEDSIDSVAFQFDGKVLVAGWIEQPDYSPPPPKLARLENDPVASTIVFYAPTWRVAENAGQATVAVARYGDATNTATVTYLTRRGTAAPFLDYRSALGALYFQPGVRLRTFQVRIIDDLLLNEGDETVPLMLARPRGARLGPLADAVLTIAENDID